MADLKAIKLPNNTAYNLKDAVARPNSPFYGSCSTAAATAAKEVTVTTGFSLVTGAKVVVKFTVTNTASNPTLNVNSTGAKAIYYRGAAISAGQLAANRIHEFVYKGTQYELIGDLDTTYSNATTSTNGLMSSTDKNILDNLYKQIGAYGVTNTTKSTNVAYVVYIDNITLTHGTVIFVRFALAGGASNGANATLDVNPTDDTSNAKPIYYKNAAVKAGVISSHDTVALVYDTSKVTTGAWRIIGACGTATETSDGLMSAADKVRLESMADGATANTGTVTSVATGAGLTGGTITTSGTIKANLVTETKMSVAAGDPTSTASRYYPAALDSNNKLAVNIPWTDTNTKVTNTLSNTTKAYITGTSSASTNTGTQYFDDGIYIEDTTSNLHVEGTINGAIPYGYCETAADEIAKTINVPGTFSLVKGARVVVKFVNGNTAANPTLNVNSTGAKAIYYKKVAIPADAIAEKATYEFIYNSASNRYELVGDINTDETTVPSAYCTTAAATAAKTAICTGYVLQGNTYIQVIMVNKNDFQGQISLNINNRGAKPIYINGAISSSTNYTLPAGTYLAYCTDNSYYFRTDGVLAKTSYTPAGSVTVNPSINATPVIVNSITNVGTLPTFTVDSGVLTITAGALPTKGSDQSVMPSNATISATGSFSDTKATISVKGN